MNLFGFFYLTFYTVEINNNLTQLQQYNNIYNYTNNFFTLIRDDASFKLKQTIARKKHVFNNYNNLKNLVKEGESDNPMFNDYTNDCNTMFFNSNLLSKTQHGLFVQYLTFECFEIIYLYSDNKHDTYDMPS